MNPDDIRRKFGSNYTADEQTFVMGIDQRFTSHFAERFIGSNVLETCTGAGFTTISLAKTANHVFTVEIDKHHQKQAIYNVNESGLIAKVTFIYGDILDESLLDNLPFVNAAFLDPDWAVTGPEHVYRFLNSNTQPPADILLSKIFEITKNIAIVLPPLIETQELINLPEHEYEKLYLGDNHELSCLYFGKIKKSTGETEFRVPM